MMKILSVTKEVASAKKGRFVSIVLFFSQFLFVEMAHAQREIYRGPIIDIHVHVSDKKATSFLEAMNRENVVTAISMANPARGSRLSVRNKKLRSLCDAEFVRHLADGELSIALIFSKRHYGKQCLGFGEVGLIHYNKEEKRKRGRVQRTHIISFESEPMEIFLSNANYQRKPVVFHIEPFYDVEGINTLQEVKKFYKEKCTKFPNMKIIAAHNGMMPPSELKELLGTCPNLYSDFKFLTTMKSYDGFRDLHPIHYPPEPKKDEIIKSEWAELMSEFSDRFMFGSDVKTDRTNSGRHSDYGNIIRESRRMVSSLDPFLQEKIMYSNAKHLFSLDVK